MIGEKYDWNISDLVRNIKTKSKKAKLKIEWTKAKLTRLKSTGKECTSRVNKNSEYVIRRKKQRKPKNRNCKFTECGKLDEGKFKKCSWRTL